MGKKRKIPLRKCVVTKEMKPKNDMIRIVKTKDQEVFIDRTGKKNGRGAYISKDRDVIEQAIQNQVLNVEFKMSVDPSIYEELKQIAGD